MELAVRHVVPDEVSRGRRGGSVSFLYDAESQLTNEQRFGTDAFDTTHGSDPTGSRLIQNANGQITSRTFNAANEMYPFGGDRNRVPITRRGARQRSDETLNSDLRNSPPSGPPTTSVWGANGNLTGETTGTAQTTLTWDPENRMASFASPTANESYLYPQDGLRKQKTTASGTTLFTWDESNCHLETDTSLNLTARRTDNPGDWGGLSYQEIDGYLNIPLFDSQGTTRFAYWFMGSSFFASANILDAWGNLLSTPPSEPNPMVYVGQLGYYTDATGYIYLRGRLYDPVNGRFINRDPIGFRGSGPNEMEYVGNEPVGRWDPAGKDVVAAPPPPGGPFARPTTCDEIRRCLLFSQGPCCKDANKVGGQLRHLGLDPSNVFTCIAWQEDNFGPGNIDASGSGNEGIGNLTDDAFTDLKDSGCYIVAKYKDAPEFFAKASDCEKAIAAFEYMMCRPSLRRYGPPYSNTTVKRIESCARCLANPLSYCGTFPVNPGLPSSGDPFGVNGPGTPLACLQCVHIVKD